MNDNSRTDRSLKRPIERDLIKQKKVFSDVKARIKMAQHERIERSKVTCRGKEFEIGQYVRRKLTEGERRKFGKKLSAVKSERYIVTKKVGNTYWIRKENDLDHEHVTKRHFNDLEPAPKENNNIPMRSEEVYYFPTPARYTDSEPERRYPRRERSSTKFFQAKFQGQHHDETSEGERVSYK